MIIAWPWRPSRSQKRNDNDNMVSTTAKDTRKTRTTNHASGRRDTTPAQTGPGQPAAGAGGVLGQGGEGGGGQEVAQVPTEQSQESPSGSSGAGGGKEEVAGELASTGFDVTPLAVIGGLCVAAAIALYRRRKTA